MSEIAPAATKAPELPLPRSVPALLSFVAGYIDIYTFLALFGLFVAQVTGSFVTAGAELVSHDVGITGKVIAIVAFLVAAALTAGLIALARDRDDLSSEREFLAVRSRLLVVLSIATGFLLGTAAGAVGYAKAGLAGIPLAVLIVASLAVWALVRERRE